MARVMHFQRSSAGAPLTWLNNGSFDRIVVLDDGSLGPAITITEVNAAEAPGWYTFEVLPASGLKTVITLDAGSGITDPDYRYTTYVIDEATAPCPTTTEIADAVWDETLSAHLGAGSTGAALNTASGKPTAAAIADAVWDEALAGHNTAGSAGATLAAGGDCPTAADIADAVWDEAVADHAGAGSTGATLAAGGGPTAAAIADAVWDEAVADHDDAGSTGAALAAAATAGPTAGAIADAVWDEATSGHTTAGSFGLAMAVLTGLCKRNYRVLSTTYDNARLTGSTVAIYASAADMAADTNRLAVLTMTATYDALGRLTGWRQGDSA